MKKILNLLFIAIMLMTISFIVMLISTLISKKSFLDREKISPFECGFDPLNHSRLPFSIRFFLIAIIFLIFDVEITLILPLILIFKFCNISTWLLSSMIFLAILLIGLFHEWNQGILNWSK